MARWIVPNTKVTHEKISVVGKIKKSLAHSWNNLNRELSLKAAIALIFGVNAILFSYPAHEFKDMLMRNPEHKNIFYMISRGCGKSEILFMLLRYTAT